MSRSEEFSPGPWRWDEWERGSGCTLADGNGEPVLDIYLSCGGGGMEPSESDGALIAAAPDLLEAAKEALWLLETLLLTGNWSDSPTGDKLRAAIAKAEVTPTPASPA